MNRYWKRLVCLLHGHEWDLVHEEGDWILGTAKNIWLCRRCDILNIAKPRKA